MPPPALGAMLAGERTGGRPLPHPALSPALLEAADATPACDLTPCRTCGKPIPWPVRKGYKGRLYREAASAYLKRCFCGTACNPGVPKGNRRERELQAVREAELRRALGNGRPLETPPPYGHECSVCGYPVRKGHPIHRDPRPNRADLIVVKGS